MVVDVETTPRGILTESSSIRDLVPDVFADGEWQKNLMASNDWLEANQPQVRRLEMVEDLEGAQLGHHEAKIALRNSSIISGETMGSMLDFCLCAGQPMGLRRMARFIISNFNTNESIKQALELDTMQNAWKRIRQELSFEEIKGSDRLLIEITKETDPLRREKLIVARHKSDSALAQLMLDKRVDLLRKTSYDRRTNEERNLGFTGYDAEEVDWNELAVSLSSIWLKNKNMITPIGDPPSIPVHELITNLGERTSMGLLAKQVKWKQSRSLSRCYHPNPPQEVFAALDASTSFIGQLIRLHELGHAFHFMSIDTRLPYVLRFPQKIWAESMAILVDGLGYEPGMLLPRDGALDATVLERARLMRAVGSMSTNILQTRWERWFYSESNNVNQHTASDYYAECVGLIDMTPMAPREWANNIYYGQFPWYGVNYVMAFFIVEQLRAYAKAHFGGVFTPESAVWLRKKCWSPGGALGWRDMLQHATGEEFKRQYFLDALTSAGLQL